MKKTVLFDKVEIINDDCLSAVKQIPSDSIDAIVTDPPYHLLSIVKRFGNPGSAKAQFGSDGAFSRASKGFMGKEWDGGDIAFRKETWAEFYRVLKPGHQLMAFAASKNSHRLACAVEDAGFTIGTTFLYVYGTGFPKGQDISKMIDAKITQGNSHSRSLKKVNNNRPGEGKQTASLPNNGIMSGKRKTNITREESITNEAKKWKGWNIALKPAYEPIIWAWKGEPTEQARNFLYTSKANKKERKGSKHPTVKSLSAMRELCKIVCPEDGTILDPFAGSGTTGEAAFLEGFKSILIEKEPEYYQDILNRFNEYKVEDSFDWV